MIETDSKSTTSMSDDAPPFTTTTETSIIDKQLKAMQQQLNQIMQATVMQHQQGVTDAIEKECYIRTIPDRDTFV